MDEILARHRKEKKDLQGRITQKKKNATKKTRKGVNDECEKLEREMAEKQAAEIEAMEPQEANPLTDAVEDLGINEPIGSVNGDVKAEPHDTQEEVPDQTSTDQNQPRKPNRQKARLARRAAEQEAEATAAAEEAENLPDLREQELSAMRTQLKKHGLSETPIRPDGHCLFSACAQGMPTKALASKLGEIKKESYQNVRYAAADFMSKHPDDFAAFMEEPLDSYVRKIRHTAEWGGELELQAIARSYEVDINVLRADGRIDKIKSGSDSKEGADAIWLAYYRHSFGLGEHYNALSKLDKS